MPIWNSDTIQGDDEGEQVPITIIGKNEDEIHRGRHYDQFLIADELAEEEDEKPWCQCKGLKSPLGWFMFLIALWPILYFLCYTTGLAVAILGGPWMPKMFRITRTTALPQAGHATPSLYWDYTDDGHVVRAGTPSRNISGFATVSNYFFLKQYCSKDSDCASWDSVTSGDAWQNVDAGSGRKSSGPSWLDKVKDVVREVPGGNKVPGVGEGNAFIQMNMSGRRAVPQVQQKCFRSLCVPLESGSGNNVGLATTTGAPVTQAPTPAAAAPPATTTISPATSSTTKGILSFLTPKPTPAPAPGYSLMNHKMEGAIFYKDYNASATSLKREQMEENNWVHDLPTSFPPLAHNKKMKPKPSPKPKPHKHKAVRATITLENVDGNGKKIEMDVTEPSLLNDFQRGVSVRMIQYITSHPNLGDMCLNAHGTKTGHLSVRASQSRMRIFTNARDFLAYGDRGACAVAEDFRLQYPKKIPEGGTKEEFMMLRGFFRTATPDKNVQKNCIVRF